MLRLPNVNSFSQLFHLKRFRHEVFEVIEIELELSKSNDSVWPTFDVQRVDKANVTRLSCHND